jgi:IclR family KDG regulon transcriptional repressor
MNNTLAKGLAVIELVSHSEQGLSLTEIARALQLAKSNVHRLLQTLVEARYLVRDERSGRYSASIKLWELGSAALSKLDLRTHAEQVMEELLETTRETVHLSVLDGDEVVYVHKLDSPNPVRAYTQIGGRARAHCVATGKAMLAFQSSAALERIARHLEARTPATITDPKKFLASMAQVRLQGYAINRGEWNENVYGIASPIVDRSGQAIAGLGLSGPKERFKAARLKEFAPLVVEAAARVSAQLGGRFPSLLRP